VAAPARLKPLEFERPIVELENKIAEIEANANLQAKDLDNLASLRHLADRLKQEIYAKLTPFEKVQIARYEGRPEMSDYIRMMIDDWEELHGGKTFKEDYSTITGLGRIGGRRIMLVGQEKGKSTDEKIKRSFGCPHPEGYRKALSKMELAEKFRIPVVTFINTPGAYPGIAAEERGQAYAIAVNLMKMSRLRTPIVSVVIGEGGSGGALGIGVGDRMAILEYAYYSVISPEGCSAILWKSSENKVEAAEAMKLTAPELKEIGVVDDVLPEPPGGAHRDPARMADVIKDYLARTLDELCAVADDELLDARYRRLRSVGEVIEEIETPAPREDATGADESDPLETEGNGAGEDGND